MEGGFEGADAGVEAGVVAAGVEVAAVEGFGEAVFEFLEAAGGGTAVEIGDGFGAWDDADALVIGWEEVVAEDLGAGVGHGGGEDDEGREVAVEGAEAVADPRADAGTGEEE